MEIVIHRQRGGGENPAARFLGHHFFEFICHGQRRQGERELASSAFVPVAKPGLVGLFQAFQTRAIERGAFKCRIQQGAAAKRQFRHVIAQLQRVIEQQQRALNIAVRQQFPQVTAKTRLTKLQAEILRALRETIGAFL
ncbi:hypothetical protein D3C78_1076340 [compost metagenome]